MATVPQLASLFDSTIKACVQQVNSAISENTIVDESVWITCTILDVTLLSAYTFNVDYNEFDTLFLLLYTLDVIQSDCTNSLGVHARILLAFLLVWGPKKTIVWCYSE